MRFKTALFLIMMIALLTACAKDPVCGNGIVEEGENTDTCCEDVGCRGDQTCIDNACVEPECTGCTYLDEEKHKCLEHECCEDEDCAEGETCTDHKCEGITCGECEYLEGEECKKYTCCEDSECDDNNDNTVDKCENPGTKTAKCTHTSLDECDTNSDCDDNDVSTEDLCLGSPKKCTNTLIVDCIDDDDYCPDGCDYTNDDDCEKNTTECDDDDIDCFYDAIEDCKLAELTWTVQDETNSSLEKEIRTYMLIEGKDDDDKCEIYFKTRDVELAFTSDYKDELEALNYTSTEIDDMESDAEDEAKEVENNDFLCKFEDYADAIDILNEWEDGDYTISMFEDYCEGDYFD